MKKIALAIIMAMLGSVSFANEIYIEQVGDSSTLSFTQDGTGNRIGDSVNKTFFGGGSNTVNIQQIGSSNELDATINGASTDTVVTTIGSGNIQNITCGTLLNASCSGSYIKQQVTGDDNIVTQTLNSGGNHTSEIVVVGSTNTITHTSTNSGATTANINVNGDSNTIGVNQSGTTAQTVSVNATGNGSSITINQSN
jgi:hypothetical protein